jgi:hypothetical protein
MHDRGRFRSGPAPDGHGTLRSFNSRAIPAILRPARRCANIHRTCGPKIGSGHLGHLRPHLAATPALATTASRPPSSRQARRRGTTSPPGRLGVEHRPRHTLSG